MDLAKFLQDEEERQREMARLVGDAQELQADQGTEGTNARLLLLADLMSHSILSTDAATKKNFEIQTDIQKMTRWLKRLTIAMAVLAFVSAYPSLKIFFADIVQLFR